VQGVCGRVKSYIERDRVLLALQHVGNPFGVLLDEPSFLQHIECASPTGCGPFSHRPLFALARTRRSGHR